MLEARMEELGLTQMDMSAICGVSQPTISRWLKGNIPKGKRQVVADALKIDVHALEMGHDGSYALTTEDIERWRNQVVMMVDNVWVMTVLAALPILMRPSGEVYANPSNVANVLPSVSQDQILGCWDAVLASPYVERVPVPHEWVLRLKLVE